MKFTYDTGARLMVRRAFYDRFSTRTQSWNSWLLSKVSNLAKAGFILDIGAGTGAVWADCADHPEGLLLTDISHGILREAALPSHTNVYRAVMPATDLAVRSGSVGIVTAFNVLYHVTDRTQVYSEVRRVLQPDGRFIFSTCGRAHFQEMREMVSRHTSAQLVALEFLLPDAVEEVRSVFRTGPIEVFPDSLAITDAAAALDYIKTTPAGESLSSQQLRIIENEIKEQIVRSSDGVWRVTTEVGAIGCTN